jgi:hypothetical protein
MDTMTIITNNVPRDIVDAYELTADERKEFDYLKWDAIEEGSDSASFVRYKGDLIDLGEFMNNGNMPECSPLRKWHGHMSDSFFSGILIRYTDDYESVVVGRYYS